MSITLNSYYRLTATLRGPWSLVSFWVHMYSLLKTTNTVISLSGGEKVLDGRRSVLTWRQQPPAVRNQDIHQVSLHHHIRLKPCFLSHICPSSPPLCLAAFTCRFPLVFGSSSPSCCCLSCCVLAWDQTALWCCADYKIPISPSDSAPVVKAGQINWDPMEGRRVFSGLTAKERYKKCIGR